MRVRLTWLLWLVAVGGADEATANWAEPVPGTLSVDVSDDRKALFIHALDIPDREVLIGRIAAGFETHVLRTLK